MTEEELKNIATQFSEWKNFNGPETPCDVLDFNKSFNGFVAGARWALKNQWHDANKGLPEDNEQVIGRYFYGCEDHSCYDDKIIYCQNNGKNWFTDFGGIAFDIGQPDMWMPIP